jgi:hypothetical protein
LRQCSFPPNTGRPNWASTAWFPRLSAEAASFISRQRRPSWSICTKPGWLRSQGGII